MSPPRRTTAAGAPLLVGSVVMGLALLAPLFLTQLLTAEGSPDALADDALTTGLKVSLTAALALTVLAGVLSRRLMRGFGRALWPALCLGAGVVAFGLWLVLVRTT